MKTLKILCLLCLMVSWLYPYMTEPHYARYDGFAFIFQNTDRRVDFVRLILTDAMILGVFATIAIAVDRKPKSD